MAQNALSRHDNPYPKGDIRYVPSFDEDAEITKAITLADIKAFHNDFYGADHAQLALVGDFDPAVIEPVVGRLFGDWKAKIPSAHVPEPYRLSAPAAQQFETPDKANAVYIARLTIPVKADDPDVVPLILANHILGGGGLKSRIMDRLRQQDGISYGAGSGLSESELRSQQLAEYKRHLCAAESGQVEDRHGRSAGRLPQGRRDRKRSCPRPKAACCRNGPSAGPRTGRWHRNWPSI